MLANRVKEWERDSWKRGMQKGIQEGKLEGKAETLISLLEVKFGELSDEIHAKFNQADEEQLQKWTTRILTAKTLGDVFGN